MNDMGLPWAEAPEQAERLRYRHLTRRLVYAAMTRSRGRFGR